MRGRWVRSIVWTALLLVLFPLFAEEAEYSEDGTILKRCSKGVKSFTIPSSVTEIGDYAFWDCRSLERITIPSSVIKIGEGALGLCSSLEDIEVSSDNKAYCSIDGILYSKDRTVLVCCPGKRSSLVIPSSVTKIGDYAFAGCRSLENFTIPFSVTEIGGAAFKSCSSLSSVTIPSSVIKIGEWAFGACRSLESIEVDSDNSTYCSIDGVLYSKDRTVLVRCSAGRTSFDIPSSVTVIGKGAFDFYDSLKSVTIPSSVTEIADGAFLCCSSLASVTIPSSVTEIGGASVFAFCSMFKLTITASRDSTAWKFAEENNIQVREP